MACFNRLYSCAAQPVAEDAKVTIRAADSRACARATGWLKWAVQLPVAIPHLLYTTFLMIKNQEMIVPVGKQLVPGRAIHRLPLPTGIQHIVTSNRIADEILRPHRSEEEGLFTVEMKGDNARLFLPVFQDLVQEPVNLEDFLFTCHSAQAQIYRKPILDFFGPIKLPVLKERLKEVIESALAYLEKQEVDGVIRCSAREFSGMFTVAVISNLLLGKKAADFADYQPIREAIDVSMEHAIMPLVSRRPTPEQEQSYQNALKVLRDTIDHSEGDFLNALKSTDMTDVQRKGVLFLMYIAGGETSSSLLEFMFWQLGQHPEYQTEILKDPAPSESDSSMMNKVLQESLRLHTPGALIGRVPRVDLEISVENPKRSRWKYQLPKGQPVVFCPYFAGRNPELYNEPNTFDPHRKELNGSLSWHPFGKGKHGCPGKWLALAEIRAFTEALLKRYEIASGPERVPRQEELLTLRLKPQVSLTLKRRAS